MDRRAQPPGHRRKTDPPGFEPHGPEAASAVAMAADEIVIDGVTVVPRGLPACPATLLGLLSLEDLAAWGDGAILAREVRDRFSLR